MTEVEAPVKLVEPQFKSHERQVSRLETQQRLEEIRRRIEERKQARRQRHQEEEAQPATTMIDEIDKMAPQLTDEEFYKSVLILETQLDLDDKTDAEQSPSVGFFSSMAEGVETIVSYINPLSWFSTRVGTNPTLIEADEFRCIHTNWYGRRLRRNFRFGDEDFQRLHPDTGDARASRKYTEISEIQIESPNAFVIKYLDQGYPDSIEASPTDIRKMMNILSYKLPHLAIETVRREPTV